MSWDVVLYDPETNTPVSVPNHQEGGTYPVGGTDDAVLNITYNYGRHYYEVLPIEDGESFGTWLNRKTGAEVIPHLERAVALLGTDRDPDYWLDSPGNAGYALSILLAWARLHPTARFESD